MWKKTVSALSNSAIDRPTWRGIPKRDSNAARPPSTNPSPAGDTGISDNALIAGNKQNKKMNDIV